jgi:hypothetical protein
MVVLRPLLCLLFAAAWLPGLAAAQAVTGSDDSAAVGAPPRGGWLPGGKSYLGLNLGRSR